MTEKTRGAQALLRTLHRLHRQKTDLTNQLERGPRQQKAGELAVLAGEHALESAKALMLQSRKAADAKQLQLKEREDRVLRTEAQLNTASSNREFTALKEQIAADRQANDVLSDEILEALEQLDAIQQQIRDRELELEKKKQDFQKLLAAIAERSERLQPELKRVEEELSQAESSLPLDMRQDYDRIIKARGEEGLAPVAEEACGACYQRLSPQIMNKLYLSNFFNCPACGAWIYLPEDRQAR